MNPAREVVRGAHGRRSIHNGIGLSLSVRRIKIVVTGGGTGGHTLPAIATVAEISRVLPTEYPDIRADFLYLGSESGLEVRMAAEAGLKYEALATGKLRRAKNPLRMLNLQNFMDALRVPQGFFQALAAIDRYKPDVVFSTGGYVSVPVVFGAGLRHIPVVMHEQTVQIGLANRMCARIARKIALSFAESARELPSGLQRRAVVTGNVVRPIIFGGDSQRAICRYAFAPEDALPTIYITGGAQGSQLINRAVEGALGELLSFCRIIHQCGRQTGSEQDEDRLSSIAAALPEALRKRYAVTAFVGEEIGDVYALAELIVGRSGAGTVSEICAVGRAALFIPLVPTGGDEQTRNAQRLVDLGAAQILKQGELSPETFVRSIRSLVADREQLVNMGSRALSQARPHAATDLAKLVIETALEPTGK